MHIVPVSAAAGAIVLLLGGCGPSPSSSALDPERVARILAELPAPYNTADPQRGRSLFTLCSACHTTVEGGANMVGPNLYGVFGSPTAYKTDFAYSDILRDADWIWEPARLDAWLADPLRVLPGTKMVFVGLPDPEQRADLIAFLAVATTPDPD